MSILKRLKSVKWNNFFLEVGLIFIGITLALWFDQIRDAYKSYDTETKLLVEISEALASDILDLSENLKKDEEVLTSINYALHHLENKLPYSDELAADFSMSTRLTVFIYSPGAYEHLKAQGVDLIKDHKLRQDIVAYHEEIVSLTRRWEDLAVIPTLRDTLNPQMLQKFRFSNHEDPSPPLDYQKLVSDTHFHNVLKQMASSIRRKNEFYEDTIEAAEKIQSNISDALKGRT